MSIHGGVGDWFLDGGAMGSGREWCEISVQSQRRILVAPLVVHGVCIVVSNWSGLCVGVSGVQGCAGVFELFGCGGIKRGVQAFSVEYDVGRVVACSCYCITRSVAWVLSSLSDSGAESVAKTAEPYKDRSDPLNRLMRNCLSLLGGFV